MIRYSIKVRYTLIFYFQNILIDLYISFLFSFYLLLFEIILHFTYKKFLLIKKNIIFIYLLKIISYFSKNSENNIEGHNNETNIL